ncbi:MAG: hypothetical protein QME96_12110 [Myxococcota bacterium]|nr:hypothetical protein [Myxococcota bacterium]
MSARGKKSSEAELLCRKWLESLGWTIHRAGKTSLKHITRPDGSPVLRRDGKPMVVNESHDLFGCVDLLAIATERGTWALQITTQGGRSERRRKMEPIPWPREWRVSLVSHEPTEDPAHRGRRKHFWRVEDFGRAGLPVRSWLDPVAVPFSPAEVEAHARAAQGPAVPGRAPVRRARKLPCGHPLSAIEGTAEGSRWCGACERERRATPLFGEARS